jgi:hypothetical protein
MTPEELEKLPQGTKLVYTYVNVRTKKQVNEVCDWGYMGETGKAVCYYEGERNMQDSFAVDPEKLALKVSPSFTERIRKIPGPDGFWKSSSEDEYVRAGFLLTKKGFTEDEAVELLSELYYAAANCYGG